jgi:PncC family amidohydrolase
MSTNHAPTLIQLRELSAELGAQLSEQNLTIALAESCTGGMLTSILTDIAGSSHYVAGGVVSYSNFAKMRVLEVSPETLDAHGAVSPETAREMARGVRALLQTDLALSVTGIAGPGGGAPEKPVGLVYLHLAAEDIDWGEMHVWPYHRIGNKQASVAAGLRLALRYVRERSSRVDLTRPAGANQKSAPEVLVEASWRAGAWRPQAVWLGGQRKQVVGVGRQERTSDDGWIMMVEFGDGGRAALQVDVQAGVWRLRRFWPARRYA